MIAPAPPLLELRDVQVQFGAGRDVVRAVDGVSLAVRPAESVGLVGESGCGKTTLGRAALGLVDIAAGEVRFEGADIRTLSGEGWRRFRQGAQMIFQDPFGSLNPRITVGGAISEVLGIHGLRDKSARRVRSAELFQAVGLDPDYLDRYPHEFSGGQRQRIGIARALAVNPRLVVADEPVSALDVSVQVQILNLLKDVQERFGLAYLFVAHDLAVVRYLCRRVLVMYLGRVVESGESEAMYRQPAHPYTEALLAAVPDVDKALRRGRRQTPRATALGDVPSLQTRIPGCPFHPRCPRAQDRCRVEAPPLREVAPGRLSACHFAEEVLAAPFPA
jgi:oligopeptide/dipeptide ABC transporter ATP-binding protein